MHAVHKIVSCVVCKYIRWYLRRNEKEYFRRSSVKKGAHESAVIVVKMQTSGSCSTLVYNGSSPSLQSAARGGGASSSRGAGGPSTAVRGVPGTTQPLAACSSPPSRKSPSPATPRPFVSTQSQGTLSTSSAVQSDDEAPGTINDQSSSTTTPSTTLPRLIVEDADIPATNCYRLVLLGSARVGKTSLVARFLGNHFSDAYTPTIEDFHRKFYRIRGDTYRLDILDTSGNDPFPAMRRLSLMTGAPSQRRRRRGRRGTCCPPPPKKKNWEKYFLAIIM